MFLLQSHTLCAFLCISMFSGGIWSKAPTLKSKVPKVVLYTGNSGGNTSFSSAAKNYPDLSVVNFDNVAKSACAIGTWIFYGSKQYRNFSDGAFVYFSKSNGCFTFHNLSERVSSFRFAGSGSDYMQNYIDLFNGVFFTEVHLKTSVEVANLSQLGFPSTTSIIVSGSQPWTLFSNESFMGRSACVYPKDSHVPRFYRNTLDFEDVHPKSIKKGCMKR